MIPLLKVERAFDNYIIKILGYLKLLKYNDKIYCKLNIATLAFKWYITVLIFISL